MASGTSIQVWPSTIAAVTSAPPRPMANGAQAAVRAGVRVGAEDDLAGLHEVAVELGVHDGHVGVVEVLDAALLGEVAREVGELLRARVAGQRDGIDGVVEREVEAVGVVRSAGRPSSV